VTLGEVRIELTCRVKAAGSQRAAAKTLRVSEQYISDVLCGHRLPGDKMLKALGLMRVVSYERRNSRGGAP